MYRSRESELTLRGKQRMTKRGMQTLVDLEIEALLEEVDWRALVNAFHNEKHINLVLEVTVRRNGGQDG